MNKIKSAISILIVAVVSYCVLPTSLNGSEPINAGKPNIYNSSLTDSNIKERISEMSIVVDISYTKEIGNIVRNYVTYGKSTEELLGRSKLYFPYFESVFTEKGVPVDLKYLSVIESSLNADAKSSVGAAGLWQFMRRTGRHYGLTIDNNIDERLDPIKSTEAAAAYLKRLHERFGDWALAISAYNCGPTRVNKAIRLANSRKFDNIQKYLPRETRKYVKKFVAMSYLLNYYYLHDLHPESLPGDLNETETVTVFDKTDFESIEEDALVDMETIKFLNPSYLNNVIPANENGNNLVLPASNVETFLINSGRMIVKEEEIVAEAKLSPVSPIESIELRQMASVGINIRRNRGKEIRKFFKKKNGENSKYWDYSAIKEMGRIVLHLRQP